MGSTEGTGPPPTSSQASDRGAPPPLDLVQDLVNTRNLMRGTDRLSRTAAGADLEALRDLREAIRAVLLTHTTGQPLDPTVVGRLRALALAAPLRAEIGENGSAAPAALDDNAVARVLAAIASAGQTGTWRRLKVCANPDCQWAFYDASRNRRGTWCDMSICGSRVKMRAYRRRAAGT